MDTIGLRQRVEDALTGAGRWNVVDWAGQSAESGGASNSAWDALGIEGGGPGTVLVRPMTGDEALDAIEAGSFEAAATAKGYDISSEPDYDAHYSRWLDGEGFDEPHQCQPEAFDAYDAVVLASAAAVLSNAGFEVCTSGDGTTLEVTE